MASSNFRVHLIFSEGQGIVKVENLYEVYGIALLPFALNVPPEQVDFTVNPVIIKDPEFLLSEANHIPLVDKNNWFPEGYHKYFKALCRRATGVDNVWDADTCAIRIVTGHGLPRKKCGRLVCEGRDVLFQEFGDHPASILTIVDVCNSQFLVAALDGHYINNDATTAAEEPRKYWGRKLNKRSQFVDNCVSASFACDNNDITYAFCVAQSTLTTDDTEDGSSLSKSFGDGVILSVLLAVRDLEQESDVDKSLDELFAARFRNIKTSFLTDGNRNPHSNLSNLQQVLASGRVTIKAEAFNCALFRNSDLWYFTETRLPARSSDGIDPSVSSAAIRYVVSSICLWHTTNPDHDDLEYSKSRLAWTLLSSLLGPDLLSIELEFDEDTKEVKPSEDGTVIEVWACTCKDLPCVLDHVRNFIASGSMLDESDSDFE